MEACCRLHFASSWGLDSPALEYGLANYGLQASFSLSSSVNWCVEAMIFMQCATLWMEKEELSAQALMHGKLGGNLSLPNQLPLLGV